MTPTSIALIKQDIAYMKKGIDRIENILDCQPKNFVSKIEFNLVNQEQNTRMGRLEKLVYGAVALGLTTMGKAILDLVVHSSQATQ